MPRSRRFFFSSRRRHTRSLRDWSSDVCSSDLALLRTQLAGVLTPPAARQGRGTGGAEAVAGREVVGEGGARREGVRVEAGRSRVPAPGRVDAEVSQLDLFRGAGRLADRKSTRL